MTAKSVVLIVDDDPIHAEFVSIVLGRLGMECTWAASADECLNKLTPDVSLILLDLVMPQFDGVELLRHLAGRECNIPITLMSGLDKSLIERTAALAETLGLTVAGYFRKPLRLSALEEHFQQWSRPSALAAQATQNKVNLSEDELVQAVESNQFILHYQPQIDIASNSVVGIEALVRCQHPTHGLVFPDSFIPQIESMGFIDRMSILVFERGLSEFQQLSSACHTALTLSVNLSASSLHDVKLPDKLEKLAKRYGIPPQQIIIEVTESRLLGTLSRALEVLIRLRMKQFEISIDDFGTGYAMMEQLSQVPATEIKIDRSFVREMHSSSSGRVFVEKTIEIGHELGLRVVAEGVETSDQLNFLRSVGCDVGQGYLFSRPMAPQHIFDWLAANAGIVTSCLE